MVDLPRYRDYEPIPAENLPARYHGCFRELDLTFDAPNDTTIVRTITGHALALVCTGDGTRGHARTPVVHAGYQKAIWELREGHLRYCPSQDRLWRRDPDVSDHDGDRLILNSWHPVKTIEDEYDIPKNQASGAMGATLLREARRSQWFAQVERGVRIDPCVWIRQGGRVVCVRDEPDLAVTQTFPTMGMGAAAIDQAWRIVRWLTDGEPSARNLMRMFATPWLEPFKQLTYVMSGHGGDGKTLLMRQGVLGVLGSERVFPGFSTVQYCSGGGYTLNRESMNDAMDGKAFAYDDEAGEVTETMLPHLRALSTGSQMQARVTGGRYRTVTPTATMVLLTNMAFADSSENSDRRRFVKIEMHPSAGRSYDEYHAIELFCHAHPGALFAASCRLWEEGDDPETVNLSPARSISDEAFWLVNEIETNTAKYGQPIASRTAYRDEFHATVPAHLLDLLGLKNSTTRVLPGGQQRVVRVTDRDRYDVYRKAALGDTDPDTAADACVDLDSMALAMPGPDTLRPIEAGNTCRDHARIVERACAGMVGFAPCEGKAKKTGVVDQKVSLSWRRLNRSVDQRQPADTVRVEQTRYCVPPLGSVFVIDCDRAKSEGGPHGFQILQAQVGEYGGPLLPSTLTTRTPHGVHLYYRTPDWFDPARLKNAVHPDDLPIDLRVAGKGYVIGPGSLCNGGRYTLVDLPDGDVIPEATGAMLAWLDEHDYTDTRRDASPPSHAGVDDVMHGRAPSRRGNGGRPDMTPIAEGSRNQTLHDWAYGRLINHPSNRERIERDLYERGRASGLQDAELRTIWQSILRHQGKA